jgi:hypothetical protein
VTDPAETLRLHTLAAARQLGGVTATLRSPLRRPEDLPLSDALDDAARALADVCRQLEHRENPES